MSLWMKCLVVLYLFTLQGTILGQILHCECTDQWRSVGSSSWRMGCGSPFILRVLISESGRFQLNIWTLNLKNMKKFSLHVHFSQRSLGPLTPAKFGRVFFWAFLPLLLPTGNRLSRWPDETLMRLHKNATSQSVRSRARVYVEAHSLPQFSPSHYGLLHYKSTNTHAHCPRRWLFHSAGSAADSLWPILCYSL
jgi:hypothetical protein